MELALQLCDGVATISNGVPALRPAILRLFEGVERGLDSSDSRRAYRTALLQFFAWCGEHTPVPSFTRLTVLQYKDALIGTVPEGTARRYAPATVNLRLAAVRALAQEAADAGLLAQSEAAAIRRVRGERASGSRIGNWLAKDQVDRALTSVDRSTVRGKRDYAMLALLFATGLRRGELVALDVAAIQQRDGQWGLIGIQGKGGKVRNIPLPGWVREAVGAWLHATQVVQGPLFRSLSRHGKMGQGAMSEESVKLVLSSYMTPLGHAAFRPHDARRTCARLCRTAHAALEDVQELLGHASIQTTERYLGKTDSFKRGITDLITEPAARGQEQKTSPERE